MAVENTQRRDVPTDPKARKEAIGHWLRQMESHVAKLSDQDRSDMMPVLCDVYWRMDDISPLARLISGIQNPKKRARREHLVCLRPGTIGKGRGRHCFRGIAQRGSNGGPNRGRTPAESAGQVACRNRPLQSSRHDFAGAKETIRRIDDPEEASWAWRTMAENQAKAGRYDDALASLAKVVPTSRNDEKAKEETRKLIAQCRASERHDPPQKPPEARFIEGLRRVSALFGDVDVQAGRPPGSRKGGGKNGGAAQ